VVPFRGVERDNILRPDTTVEKLAALKPAFDKVSGKGTLTAGNSTPLTDGASAALLASEDWAKRARAEVLAWLVDAQVAAVDFVHGEGLLMAPAWAVAQMLKRNGLTLQDFDFYEIHEAFAAQVLCTLKAWESADFCRDKLGLDAPLGSIDRERAQRGRLVAGARPSVRRHRRAHRRHRRQAARGEGRRPRADLGVHRRRHGRGRHPRALTRAPRRSAATRRSPPASSTGRWSGRPGPRPHGCSGRCGRCSTS
jgi:hypothetical protein